MYWHRYAFAVGNLLAAVFANVMMNTLQVRLPHCQVAQAEGMNSSQPEKEMMDMWVVGKMAALDESASVEPDVRLLEGVDVFGESLFC